MSHLAHHDPVFAVLTAQAANIARIDPGVEVSGTGINAEKTTLHSKRPDLVRLYDTPDRLVADKALNNWQSVVTLTPVSNESAGRIANRTDRTFAYHAMFLVRLTDQEAHDDHKQLVQMGMKSANPLAEKVQRLALDFHLVFHDNFHLKSDECPTGLVDDHTYSLRWDAVEYPAVMFTAQIQAAIGGYG